MKIVQKLLQEVQQLNKDKDFIKTIELLPVEILEKYKYADLYAEKAMAYWNTRQYDECERMALIALQFDKVNAKAHHYMGQILQNKADFYKAKEHFLAATEIDPYYSYAYYGLGNVHYQLKEYEEANELYLKANKLDLKDPHPYIGLGNICYQLKEFGKAKQYYLKAFDINPKLSKLCNVLGNVNRELGEFEEAKEYYLKAKDLDPNNPNPYNGLGNVYSSLKDYEKAKEFYLKAIEIDNKMPYPYNGLGNLYSDLNDFEKANEYYLKAIKIDAKSDAPYYNLGRNYFEANEFKLAKRYFGKYITLTPDKKDFFYQNAVAKIEAIGKLLDSSTYKKVNELVQQIKELLLFKDTCVSHYTSISTIQLLILKESPLRLSEGSFLNDTSEGQELFKFLEFPINKSQSENEEIFAKRPFIGSFVDAIKYNDLTLWRMYGKEALEEAKGCSLTISVSELKDAIQNKIKPSVSASTSKGDDIEFYRVAYRSNRSFDFAGANKSQRKALVTVMNVLKDVISKFKRKPLKNRNEEIGIIELINEIAYLFKSVEYQYENEIRLVITDAIGFEKKIDFDATNFIPSKSPNKVYIDLVPVLPLLKSITIGPKVDKPEEWASTFHYHLLNKGFKPEIHISKLPFK